jgi:hypothetical protein
MVIKETYNAFQLNLMPVLHEFPSNRVCTVLVS